MSTSTLPSIGPTNNDVVSTRYKCSVHGVWLTLRTVHSSVGVFRFWQCPVEVPGRGGNDDNVVSRNRCQYCKPCKGGERHGKRL